MILLYVDKQRIVVYRTKSNIEKKPIDAYLHFI